MGERIEMKWSCKCVGPKEAKVNKQKGHLNT